MKKSLISAIVTVSSVLMGCDGAVLEAPPSPLNANCPEVNVLTDNLNCGECDYRCSKVEQCVSGHCVDMSESECPDADLNTDSKNCGACGKKCSSKQQCVSGKCVKNEDSGIDFNTDHENCGKKGNACKKNQACLGGTCVENAACAEADFMMDSKNCGSCGVVCGQNTRCNGGKCECDDNYYDCDGNGTCETEGECECHLGDTEPCYWGNPETENVGRCHGGYVACSVTEELGAVMDYANCIGQVLPVKSASDYTCKTPETDDDCNGIPDSEQDEDGDRFPICRDGRLLDCCDNSNMCGTNRPDLVNPGKVIDCNGNELDDDCDGDVDEDIAALCTDIDKLSCDPTIDPDCDLCERIENRSCSTVGDYGFFKDMTSIMLDNYTKKADRKQAGLALLHAMDVCVGVVTKESGQSGLIEYSLSGGKRVSDGVEVEVNVGQVNVLAGMHGSRGEIKPRTGDTFAVLSTGAAVDAKSGVMNDVMWDKNYQTTEEKDENGVIVKSGKSLYKLPEPYSSAHHGKLQSHPSCKTSSEMFDPVHLHMQMRAPHTAYNVTFDFRFLTQEYPAFVCTPFNDFFVVLLTDEKGKSLVPGQADGNISFDEGGNPISVNNSFFTTCAPYLCTDGQCKANSACDASTNTCKNACEANYEELYAYTNTPYTGKETGCKQCTLRNEAQMCTATKDVSCTNYMADYPVWGQDVLNDVRGGGTAWLTTSAPVSPGQVFNLDFYLWDTGDSVFDSTVILDNFQWGCDEELARAGTDFAGPIENIH